MKIPPPFNWAWAGWMTFSHLLGIVMSHVILTILWIVGFGMYAIPLKIITRVRPKKTSETHWVDPQKHIENGMKYQF